MRRIAFRSAARGFWSGVFFSSSAGAIVRVSLADWDAIPKVDPSIAILLGLFGLLLAAMAFDNAREPHP